jgi:REP element-mobilizing transposase RayT
MLSQAHEFLPINVEGIDMDILPIEIRHRRRSIRYASHDYSAPGAYFLTICTQGRAPLFGQIQNDRMSLTDAGRQLGLVWLELASGFPDVTSDEFVVMPDHVHGIVMIGDMGMVPNIGDASTVGAIHESPLHRGDASNVHARRRMTISRFVGRFKMTTAKWINIQRGTPGSPVWQRNFYDRVIRDAIELEHVRAYILDNPRRWNRSDLWGDS